MTAISFGFGTAITLIGIPVLIGTMWAWRWLAELERGLFARCSSAWRSEPYRPDPAGARWWPRVAARLADPATWKDLAFLLLQLPLGIVIFHRHDGGARRRARALLFAPAYYWPLPDDAWIASLARGHALGGVRAVPLGALVLLARYPGARAPWAGSTAGWPRSSSARTPTRS